MDQIFFMLFISGDLSAQSTINVFWVAKYSLVYKAV